MSLCETCLSFFKYKRKGADYNKIKDPAKGGTCWVDGSKTMADWSCGMHSDNYPKAESELAPDKRTTYTFSAAE